MKQLTHKINEMIKAKIQNKPNHSAMFICADPDAHIGVVVVADARQLDDMIFAAMDKYDDLKESILAVCAMEYAEEIAHIADNINRMQNEN